MGVVWEEAATGIIATVITHKPRSKRMVSKHLWKRVYGTKPIKLKSECRS